jgi:CTP synthase
MRLGNYESILKPGSIVAKLYGATTILERHRHRYEIHPAYHEKLEAHGLCISGTSPDGRLAEFLELPEHPFYVATQAHPEFRSRLQFPHPLFLGFVEASI